MKYKGSCEAAAGRLKRNLARAKGSLRKKEYSKAIKEAKLAFAARTDCDGLVGQKRIEVDFSLQEFCTVFSGNQGILELLERFKIRHRPFITYNRGGAATVISKLDILATRLDDHIDELSKAELAKVQESKEKWISKGRACLERGELPLGRSCLRRAADDFGHEQGVLVTLAEMLLDKDLHGDAAEFLERSRKLFPQESRAYTLGVKAHMEQGEWEKAEAIYKKALKIFGNHAITQLNLAKLYVKWNKRDKAWEYARLALEQNPELAEAKEIMKRTG